MSTIYASNVVRKAWFAHIFNKSVTATTRDRMQYSVSSAGRDDLPNRNAGNTASGETGTSSQASVSPRNQSHKGTDSGFHNRTIMRCGWTPTPLRGGVPVSGPQRLSCLSAPPRRSIAQHSPSSNVSETWMHCHSHAKLQPTTTDVFRPLFESCPLPGLKQGEKRVVIAV
ncbi:hypothetical protein BU23DRAFT_650537 [Bimuria novae-zelandiae CBS 107.79]|uniref:Uncharacterized protein n=1 Tax=Bimuria novae-zelandiae CBS 107.79 TaxID=1447943 RepID=A0A6A5V0I9_9PLEO|nr:hypothetical protein BU23DRAFT_650537 [Bimuria novae-zelandiae CBS 107.79]